MSDGPYSACLTSSNDKSIYGISGPGYGLGYYAWLGYPQNTFPSFEDAEKTARLMNLAFKEGQRNRSRQIKDLLE